jgi:hypothetical protein
MKALLYAIAIACALLMGWLLLVRHPDRVAPVIPDAHPAAVADEQASPPAKLDARSPASTSKQSPTVASQKPRSVHELNVAEVKVLETETPPAVIEGIVLRHDEPITTGGLVFCQIGDGFYTRLPEHPRERANDVISSSVIDQHGEFRIENLAPDSYTLGLDLGHGMQNERRVTVADRPGKRLVIVLGGAGVHGRVYDTNGQPLPNAKVTIGSSVSETALSRIFRTSRTTGFDGTYAITDLNAGNYWLGVDLQGTRGPSSYDVMQRITLAVDEDRAIDIGSAEPSRTWTGTIKTTSGDHVHGGGRVHLTRRPDNAYSENEFGEDGAIQLALQRGEYGVQVSLNVDPDRRIDEPDLSIGAANITRDITLPGTRVSGVVIDAATGLTLQHSGNLTIGLRIRDRIVGGPHGAVDENGSFAIDAVEPGTWLVSTHPQRLAEGELEVTVHAEDVDIPLRLTVRTR